MKAGDAARFVTALAAQLIEPAQEPDRRLGKARGAELAVGEGVGSQRGAKWAIGEPVQTTGCDRYRARGQKFSGQQRCAGVDAGCVLFQPGEQTRAALGIA